MLQGARELRYTRRKCQWHQNVRRIRGIWSDAPKEPCEVARHEIDKVFRGIMRDLEGFAMVPLAGFRHDEHRRHSSFMRNNEIFREILEHNGSRRIDRVPFEKSFVGGSRWLRHEIGVSNVKYILEHRLQAKRPGGQQGMFARPVRQNELASGQGRDGGCESGIRQKRGAVDVMREIEKFLRANAIFHHQAAQGRAVAPIIIFLQRPGRHAIKSKEIAEVQRDPLIDLRPQIAIGRIERVVEIEDPSVDVR